MILDFSALAMEHLPTILALGLSCTFYYHSRSNQLFIQQLATAWEQEEYALAHSNAFEPWRMLELSFDTCWVVQIWMPHRRHMRQGFYHS